VGEAQIAALVWTNDGEGIRCNHVIPLQVRELGEGRLAQAVESFICTYTSFTISAAKDDNQMRHVEKRTSA
jgi:hypothetical protein